MREIVLDTETTGLDPVEGHRIVEIGGVELHNHMPTGRTYHQYINPQRDMPEEALAVHGITEKFLADKPVVADIAQDFLDFVGDAKLVIHNAAFDMKFLNAELSWVEKSQLSDAQAVDTLLIARKKFPGAQNSLDALCRRFNVDNSARDKHGALLDSEILAEVYLELIGGRQPDFGLSVVASTNAGQTADPGSDWAPAPRPAPLPSRLTQAERQAHKEFVAGLADGGRWAE